MSGLVHNGNAEPGSANRDYSEQQLASNLVICCPLFVSSDPRQVANLCTPQLKRIIMIRWFSNKKNDKEIHLTSWILAPSSNLLPAPHLLPFFNVRGAGLRGQRAHPSARLLSTAARQADWQLRGPTCPPQRPPACHSVWEGNKRLPAEDPINPQVSEKPQTHAGTQTCVWIKRTHKDAFVHIHAVMHCWTDTFVSAYLHTCRCFKHLPRQETRSSATRLVVYSDSHRLWF